ncbi:hypothetical protein XBO1_1100009 [Xenorhabdus bovienii str. oregonense]|uniref:Uncharacterized protein n=2 Tax=Xenorhabdus bovienii TaxID=40576 RepID=A0A077QLF7_XENBV|nr:hypothetical protein XBO1_1100009 [Xenorhabdus bovienii str. oregonense]CDH34434.1 hypothetical protein XBI1_3080008 [Xenorhabdus bovienii str. Intermedium]
MISALILDDFLNFSYHTFHVLYRIVLFFINQILGISLRK